MTRLLGAELLRLVLRRMTWLGLVVVIGLVALSGLAAADQVTPPSAAERAEAQGYYEEELRTWEADHEEWEQECREEPGVPEEACVIPRPDPVDFGVEPVPFADAVGVALTGTVALVALTGYLVAASFVAAEFTTGAIGNWLTFVPRRTPVLLAKLAAAAAYGVVLMLLAGALSVAVPAVAAVLSGGSLTGLNRMAELSGRALLVGLFAAVAGFCAGVLTRHTAAALGLLLGYLFVVFVRNVILYGERWAAELTRFTPEGNAVAVLNRGYTYQVPTGTGFDEDTGFATVDRTISFAAGLGYWAVLLAVAVTAAVVVFRRRDVP